MTAHHQLFIITNKPEHRVIADLAAATGTEITPIQAVSEGPTYGGKFDDSITEVETQHDFDDDLGIKFSQYPMVVTIRDASGDKSAEEKNARDVSEKLKNIGGYKLLLAFDLQKLLAQFRFGGSSDSRRQMDSAMPSRMSCSLTTNSVIPAR